MNLKKWGDVSAHPHSHVGQPRIEQSITFKMQLFGTIGTSSTLSPNVHDWIQCMESNNCNDHDLPNLGTTDRLIYIGNENSKIWSFKFNL